MRDKDSIQSNPNFIVKTAVRTQP